MTFSAETGAVVLDVLVGLGVLLIGVSALIFSLRAGGLLLRLNKTLDEVDRQIGALSAPIAVTLSHVGGIADTADATIARLGTAVAQLETVAANAGKTVNLIGATIAGATASRRTKVEAEGVRS